MCSDRSITPPRLPCTPSATACAWSWLPLGRSIVRGIFPADVFDSVNVTTVVTGGVQSRIARAQRTLLPNSLYTGIEDQYVRRVSHSQNNAMPHDAYARSVVAQILYGSAPWRWIWPWAQGRKTWIWEGHRSWVVWLLSAGWAWSGLFGWIMTRMFGLSRLRAFNSKRN